MSWGEALASAWKTATNVGRSVAEALSTGAKKLANGSNPGTEKARNAEKSSSPDGKTNRGRAKKAHQKSRKKLSAKKKVRRPVETCPSDSLKERIEAIKAECVRQGITQKEQIAYILATADHETNHTFKPVTEAYWLKNPESYLQKKDYYPYYGRGYVQLTWEGNYEKYGNLLNQDLVNNPDLALDPKNASYILVHGFKNGTFTGKKISDYINDDKIDFQNARRCINGTDRAADIAKLAEKYV